MLFTLLFLVAAIIFCLLNFGESHNATIQYYAPGGQHESDVSKKAWSDRTNEGMAMDLLLAQQRGMNSAEYNAKLARQAEQARMEQARALYGTKTATEIKGPYTMVDPGQAKADLSGDAQVVGSAAYYQQNALSRGESISVPQANQMAMNAAYQSVAQGAQNVLQPTLLPYNPVDVAREAEAARNTISNPQPIYGQIGASGMVWSGTGWTRQENLQSSLPAPNYNAIDPYSASGIYASVSKNGVVNPGVVSLALGQGSPPALAVYGNQPSVKQMGGDAYNIVSEMLRKGQNPDPTLYAKAVEQGYGGQAGIDSLKNIDMMAGRSTVPIRSDGEMVTDKSGRTTFVPYMGNTNVPMTGGMNNFVPISMHEQQVRENSKIAFNDYGAYSVAQVVPSTMPGFTRIYPMITAGGGTGALQSGTVSGKAQTPLVYDAYGLTPLFDTTNPTYQDMLKNPQNYSRLGSELYGGKVQPLTGKTLQGEFVKGNTVMPGRFARDSMNYSNLVDFGAVNRPKSEMARAELPLYAQSSFDTTPLFQKVDTTTGKLEAVYPNFEPVVTNVIPYQQPEFILARGEPVATIYRQAPEPSRLDSDKYQRPGGMALINNPNWDVTKDLAENAMATANADEMFADYGRNPKFITQTWMEPQPYKLIKNPLYGMGPASAKTESSMPTSVGGGGGEATLSTQMTPVTSGFGSIMGVPIVSIGQPIKNNLASVTRLPDINPDQGFTNYAMEYWGPTVGPILSNIYSSFSGHWTPEKRYLFTEPEKIVDYSTLPKTGGADYSRTYIGADNKPTQQMTFAEGAPFMKDGVEYQNYKNSDLSKVTIRPQTIVSSASESRFDTGEKVFSDWVTKPLIPEAKISAEGRPSDFIGGFQNYVREKPLTLTKDVGVYTAMTAGFMLASPVVGGYIATLGSGTSKIAPLARVGTWLGEHHAVPIAFTGFLGYEGAKATTKDFTDYSPKGYARAGEWTASTLLPLGISGGLSWGIGNAMRIPETSLGASAPQRGGQTPNTRTFMDIYSDVTSPEYNPALVAKLRARGVTGGAGNMGTNIQSPAFDINTGEELGIFAKAGRGGVPTGASAPRISFDMGPKGVKTPMVPPSVAEPVAMTTLYRGEAPGLGYSTPEKGLWFTDVPAYASGYSGETGKIFSVNVPTTKLSNYFVQERNLLVGKNTANEYLLPESIAQQRVLYTGERDFRGARVVTSPVAMPSAMGVPMMNVVSPRPAGGIHGRFSRATTPSPTAYLDALPVISPGRGMATTYNEGGLPSYKIRARSIETQNKISTNLYGMPENMVVGATVPFKLPSGVPRGFEKWNGILLEGGGEGSSGGSSARSVAKSNVVSKTESLLKIKRLGEDEFVKRRPSVPNIPSFNTAENVGVLSVEGIGIVATPLLFSAPKSLPTYAATPKPYNKMFYDSSVLTGSETVFGPLTKVGIKAKVSPTSGPTGTSRSETTPSGITLPSSETSSKLAVGVSPAMGVIPMFGTISKSGTKSIAAPKVGPKTLSDSLSISKMVVEAKPISDGVATSDAKSIVESAADVMSLPSSLPITTPIPIITPRVTPTVGLAPPDEITKKVPNPKIPVPPLWPGIPGFGGGSSGSAGGVRGRVHRETLVYDFGLKSQKKGLLKIGGTGLGSVGKNTMFGGNYESLLKINVPSVKKPIVAKSTTKKTLVKKSTTSTNGFTLNNLKSISLPSSLPTKKKKK